MSTGFRYIRKHFFAIEALPIIGIVSVVMSGGTWYLYRISQGPSIVWTRANPQPWNSIKEDETPKIMTIHQQASHGWHRDKL
ncbi:hypothetical protein PENSPDRAFT_692654 [Peniophora sp. CONT]|nr:hypothetical protein PENSPDRAFT_692654 [Peniophora sp. CONT]